MHIRIVLVALFGFSLPASSSWGQLERIQDRDIRQWMYFSQISTAFELLDLSPDSLDKLLELQLKQNGRYVQAAGRMGANVDINKQQREDLQAIYEHLTDQQARRFNQLLFQSWMNANNLAPAIEAFAPGVVQRLSTELERLTKKIEDARDAAVENLDTDAWIQQQGNKDPIVDLIKLKWQLQVSWLKEHFGDVKTKELLGEPVAVSYRILVAGTHSPALVSLGIAAARSRHARRSSSINDGNHFITTELIHPITGAVPIEQPQHGRRTQFRLRRPVNVPTGWTQKKAREHLLELETQMQDLSESYGEQISEIRMLRGGNPRDAFEKRRLIQHQLRTDSQLLNIEIEKAQRIVEELGGDPLGEYEEAMTARRTFQRGGLACNSPLFQSHIQATAKQCDALDHLWRDQQAKRNAGEYQEVDYHTELFTVLDKQQSRILKQMLFRRYWYSAECELAFSLTKIELTEQQESKIADLSAQFTSVQTNEFEARRNRAQAFPMGPVVRLRPRISPETQAYVGLKKAFDDTLAQIVGADKVPLILGEMPTHDPNWKRPVTIPEGLNLAAAKKQLQDIRLDLKNAREREKEAYDDEVQLEVDAEVFEQLVEAAEQEVQELQQKEFTARRYVEELTKQSQSSATGEK